MAVDGTFKFEQDTPMGKIEGEFVFTTDGSTLTGSVSSKLGSEKIVDGTIDGDKLKFSIKAKGPMGEMTVVYDATVSGDNIEGSAKAGSFPGSSFKGTRVS